jgi:hypothetical protein
MARVYHGPPAAVSQRQLLAERARREVVADEERTDPGGLDAARVIGPRRAVQDGLAHHPEPDLPGHVLPSR